MVTKTIFEIKAIYRDDFRITGYQFGEGRKAACIIGSLRGNEVQQLYTCSMLVRKLKEIEEAGGIKKGKQILVIPTGNPYSMNVKKRFWSTDNTDINRMFPGYDKGETTQRIAAGIFDEIKDYLHGIQFTSFYMPGTFMPHIRMMVTGFENIEGAKKFGMPYIVLRQTRPYDTTTLNYNWQIWETKAYSIYTNTTDKIDEKSAKQAVRAILNYLSKEEIIDYQTHGGYISKTVSDQEMISVRAQESGFFECKVSVEQEVEKGQLLARIVDPLNGQVKAEVVSPVDGIIFFAHSDPLTYSHTAVFKIVTI